MVERYVRNESLIDKKGTKMASRMEYTTVCLLLYFNQIRSYYL